MRKYQYNPTDLLRSALERENVKKDIVQLSPSLQWETSCKAADAEMLERFIEFLTCAMIRRSDKHRTTLRQLLSAAAEAAEIYIRSEQKVGQPPNN